MARKCTICTHEDRDLFEIQIASGLSYALISRESRSNSVSPDALERHWSNHVEPEMRVAVWSDGIPALTLSERIMAMDSDASVIRKQAIENGDDRTALAAIKTSCTMVAFAADRLGIKPEDTQQKISEAQMLFSSIAAIISETPRAAKLFIDRIPPEGVGLISALKRIATAAELAAADQEL